MDALKKNLVQGLTKDDIIIKTGMDSTGNTMKIFVLNSPRFIKEYQGRLYVESVKEALNSDGSINTDALGEVVSVAVEHYFMTPRATKKYFPDMYRIVEETLHECSYWNKKIIDLPWTEENQELFAAHVDMEKEEERLKQEENVENNGTRKKDNNL